MSSLVVAGVGVRLVRFPRLMTWTEESSRIAVREPVEDDVRRARRFARYVGIAARVVPATCLTRSLAVHRWAHRQGLPSILRIGIRKDGAELQAHAWVELAGSVITDRRAHVAAFTPLPLADGEPVSWPKVREGDREPTGGVPPEMKRTNRAQI